MVENEDLSLIAKSCDLFNPLNTEQTIIKIDNLQKGYSERDLVKIYNYFLQQTQNPDIMAHLIQCLDRYRDSSSAEVFVDLLLLRHFEFAQEQEKENFTNVRIMCAKAIANQKNTDYVSALLYCLNNKNENYRIRLACADALGRIGDKYAVAPLINVVKDEDEKSVYVRESAALALGLLGDSRAIEPLVNILETKKTIIDKFSFLKERVIEALNKVGFSGNERVFKALKNSLDDESTQVRIDAIEAIMDSEHPKAFETIKYVLENDTDEEVKKNALIALYNLSDRQILDEVIKSDKYSDTLKMAAVEIIDEYENEEQND